MNGVWWPMVRPVPTARLVDWLATRPQVIREWLFGVDHRPSEAELLDTFAEMRRDLAGVRRGQTWARVGTGEFAVVQRVLDGTVTLWDARHGRRVTARMLDRARVRGWRLSADAPPPPPAPPRRRLSWREQRRLEQWSAW